MSARVWIHDQSRVSSFVFTDKQLQILNLSRKSYNGKNDCINYQTFYEWAKDQRFVLEIN